MKDDVVRICCDESRQTAERYMLLGGLWIPEEHYAEFDSTCDMVRREFDLVTSHVKWQKVRSSNLEGYKGLIDVFFDFMSRRAARFRCIVVDTHTYPLDHDKYANGDAELGFFKFYFWMIFKGLDPELKYNIWLADKPTREPGRLEQLRDSLNGRMWYHPKVFADVVKAVEPRHAEDVNAIQVADLLIGAIGFYRNDWYHKPGAKAEKIILHDHIARKLGWSDLGIGTGREHPFSIWNFISNKS